MARNVNGRQQAWGDRDSRGEILATSVYLCSCSDGWRSVWIGASVYDRYGSSTTDPEDLEFTLAVADTVGVALEEFE